MNNSTLKSITIVGGGSTGWMTALYLSNLYNHSSNIIDIKLIESKEIGIIGVGEATVHSLRFFFAAMGLDENELLKETNATLKTGILFRNWMKPVDDQTHEYFHPFEQQKPSGKIDNASAWLLNNQFCESSYTPFAEATSLSFSLMKKNLSPKTQHSNQYQGIVPYGYHLDATLMAAFLKRKAIQSGVEHIEANVTEVLVCNDKITEIQTDHGAFTSDIFIDCTGFKGLLIESLKKDNWQSFENELPCNKAVAMQREYLPHQTPRSYTTATALSHGWAWEIDLTNRQGTGYVYDGRSLTREQAEAELKEYLGNEQEIIRTVHLDMKIGCRHEFWIGNCIAIGLAGGFIEPLESTGLHLINLGARLLATHLTSSEPSQSIRASYNNSMNGLYNDLRQFIVLHYCLTDRDDNKFWKQAAQSSSFIPSMEQKLTLWKEKVCEFVDLTNGYTSVFTDENYRYILYGMQHVPEIHIPCPKTEVSRILDRLKTQQYKAEEQSLSHKEFLAKIQNVQK